MIPCHVCGQDAGAGWIIGFPPAPDSQKLGLCRAHDNPARREGTQAAWEALLRDSLQTFERNQAARLGRSLFLLSLYFTGGASLSLPCLSLSATDNNTLKALTPEDELVFFPLEQVRSYTLAPLRRAEAPEEAAAETEQQAGQETDLKVDVKAEQKTAEDTAGAEL